MQRIKHHRERLNLTQSELADRAGLSLRTVQRIEAGNEPKGHTLRSLAAALEVEESALKQEPVFATQKEDADISKIRLLNTLTYSFLFIPYGNLLFPLLYWRKNRNSAVVYSEGLKLINFQIFWTLMTSLGLLLSPYLQQKLSLSFSLILWMFGMSCCINLLFLIRNSILLNKGKSVRVLSPIRFL